MGNGIEVPDPKDVVLCSVLDAAMSNRMFSVERMKDSTFAIYTYDRLIEGEQCLFKWKDDKRLQLYTLYGIDARMALKLIRANWENRVRE